MSSAYWQIGESTAIPYWQLGDREPPWELAGLRKAARPRIESKVEIYRAVPATPELLERAGGAEASSTLTMRFSIFGKWQEIVDSQGHYLERIAHGAFAKSIKESLGNIRAVLSHGKDPSLGQTVLGKIESIREEMDGAIARVSLFPSVPTLLLDGLRGGVYGSSWRGQPIKSKTEYPSGPTVHNPLALPEVTRLEIRLRDVGPTPFAAYEGTTAMIESTTDTGCRRDPSSSTRSLPGFSVTYVIRAGSCSEEERVVSRSASRRVSQEASLRLTHRAETRRTS